MAITKLTRMKEAPRGNKAARLRANLYYICNDDKTDNGRWVGGNAGSTPEIAYRTMIENKRTWSKETGTQGFHYILSFPSDCGIDEALAYQIAGEFCQELLGDDYYYIFAVHNDKKHMHVHITFDSVSKTDGYKFHSPKGDWEQRIQPITDRLCAKYHLPTLDYNPEETRGRNYGDWKKKDMPEEQREKYYTWNDIIRDDIDEAIQRTDSYAEFLSYLKNEGYTITRSQNVLSLRPKGRERAVRTARLGDGYSREEIIQRISDKQLEPGIEERYKTYGNREEMREIIYAKIVRVQGWQMSPMQKQFWRRWNNTYFIRKPGFMSPEEKARHKEDILVIRELTDSLNYMIDHDIETPEDLVDQKGALEAEQEALQRELRSTQTKLRMKQPMSDVACYLKLCSEDEAQPPGIDTEKQKEELIEKIETVCPLGEAVSSYQELSREVTDLHKMLKDNRKEIKIVDETSRLFYKMEPDKALHREEEKEESKTSPISISDQEQRPEGNHFPGKQRSETDQVHPQMVRDYEPKTTRITINEKMFRNVGNGDVCVTRIPYRQDYVMIPDTDCRCSDHGTILTAWLKDDQEYPVLSSDFKSKGTIPGRELKQFYDDKTLRKERPEKDGKER